MYVCIHIDICMYLCMYVFMYVCMYICFSPALSVNLSIYLAIYMFVTLYVCISIYRYACISIYHYIYLSIYNITDNHKLWQFDNKSHNWPKEVRRRSKFIKIHLGTQFEAAYSYSIPDHTYSYDILQSLSLSQSQVCGLYDWSNM